MMGPIKPGDRFFRVYRRGRQTRTGWVVVTKIGRKWAEFSRESGSPTRGRFDIETLEVDSQRHFTVLGRVYRTEEEYRDQERLSAVWREFRQRVDRSYQPPDKLTLIDILKAADALGFRLKEE